MAVRTDAESSIRTTCVTLPKPLAGALLQLYMLHAILRLPSTWWAKAMSTNTAI